MIAGRAFSVAEPVLPAQLAIEASAGTGKTFALSSLATRLVATGRVTIGELLVVTFTRAAAAELRDRIRSRLVQAADSLAGQETPDDELLAMLHAHDRSGGLRRVERAVADFDSAAIGTIHGFAQQVLASLGLASTGNPDASLVDDVDSVVDQVCVDVLAAEALTAADHEALPSLRELSIIVRTVLGNPGAQVVPSADPAESSEACAHRSVLVTRAVGEVHRRQRMLARLSFDDLLTGLRDALARAGSAAALEAVRRRFSVALIDEFQDTDPVQWEIFQRLFGDAPSRPDARLVLVGDPKQAIYAFRGANVHTYLRAISGTGAEPRTLAVNWRSDGALLQALGALFEGTTFGDPRIAFTPVRAADRNRHARLQLDGDHPPAVEVRLVLDPDLRRKSSSEVYVDEARRAVADDLAAQVVDLLDRATLPAADGEGGRRRVAARDIAVLVCRNDEGAELQRALGRVGVPAVVQRGDSVLSSEAATQWRWLLTGLMYPARPTHARTAALSWFFGWSAEGVDEASDDELAAVQEQLVVWADVLAARGVIDLCRQVWADSEVAARVLATPHGDRNLTDLEHVAELLQSGAGGSHNSPAGLLAALAELDREAVNPEDDVAARRIESDADAVQIMTVWAAKGLEFPIVCAPTMWRDARSTKNPFLVFEHPVDGRTIDVAPRESWPDRDGARDRKQLARREEIGEHLRLLYVALTRAKHRVIVWWCNASQSNTTALARVLFARDGGGSLDGAAFGSDKVAVPPDDELVDRLASLVDRSDGTLAITGVTEAADRRLRRRGPASGAPPVVDLTIATLDHLPDRRRRRWSFSAIGARAAEDLFDLDGGLPDEPVESSDDLSDVDSAGPDEPVESSDDASDDEPEPDTSELPLGDIAAGATFGSLVHDILEHVDFAARDLDAELRVLVHDRLRWVDWPVDPEHLVRGLRAAIETPLGPILEGRRLRDIDPRDRLAELSFEIVLGSGGVPATDRALGRLLLDHLDDDDLVRPWAERLAGGLFGVELAGHLTGEIDAVFRIGQGDGVAYVVCDYKTNALHERSRSAGVGDYHPDRLATEMGRHHYPLQALLYSVALHRYLRWRVPGYEPERHLGGVAYLFLRGLAGPSTPAPGGQPHGVFAWRPPAALVDELSRLLDGRAGIVGAGVSP